MHTSEIGGDFDLASEWTTSPLRSRFDQWMSEHKSVPKFRTSLATGREALFLLLNSDTLASRNRMIVPAFICESVIDAVPPHMSIDFVDIDAGGNPRIEDLESALAIEPENTSVIMIPLFGHSYPAALADVFSSAQSSGVSLIHDLTHEFFSVQTIEDLSFASLRKWFPTPDGALCFTEKPVRSPDLNEADWIDERVRLMQSKYLWRKTTQGKKETFWPRLAELEQEIGPPSTAHSMSQFGKDALHRLDVVEMIQVRRRNAMFIENQLAELEEVHPIRTLGSSNACPIGVPIQLPEERRDKIRADLAKARIYCPVHWVLPRTVDPVLYSSAAQLSRTVLTLPCDQRYTEGDMEHLLDVFEQVVKN